MARTSKPIDAKDSPYWIELPGGIPVISGHYGTVTHHPGCEPVLLPGLHRDLHYIQKGTATYELANGKRFQVRAGHFLMLPFSVPTWLLPPDRTLSLWFFHFSFLPIPGGVYPTIREDCMELGRKVVLPAIFSSKEAPGLLEGCQEALACFTESAVPWRSACGISRMMSALGALALRLDLPANQNQLEISERVDPRLLELCKMISDNPEKQWKISEMAKSLKISRGHLNHLCRTNFRIDLKRFIMEKRLDRAAYFLRSARPSQSVKEISTNCGFSSQEYFARQFKKRYMLSPSDYRAQWVKS